MPLIQVVVVLIVVGILLWLVSNYVPMQGSIKSILNAVVVMIDFRFEGLSANGLPEGRELE
jgi:hypothetical protein